MSNKIPKYIISTIQKLEKAGFEAYIVGGCVRDLMLGTIHGEPVEPKDWDIATNAKPEEIVKVFPDGKYENEFGTVMVSLKYIEGIKEEEQNGENVEITTYRIESKYSDKRHPDKVRFAKTLEEDLSRRDFTINAMAIKIQKQEERSKNKEKSKNNFEIIDLFQGQKDLENKIIRAVGDANERFDEDALRMMRAVRFACQLSDKKQEEGSKNKEFWEIEEKTFEAIRKNAKNLKYISEERIRDEFNKIILSRNPSQGIELLTESKLMDQFIPEVLETIGVKQNRHHYYGPYNTVYAHMLASLEKCPSEKLEVRLASFFHDIGKPKSKRGTGEMATFYSHEYFGARIVEKILERMKYPRKVIEKTVLLVKNHMFYYNVDEVGETGVRRVIRKVGLENINDLIDVRIADRLGSGVPKAVPYKLRHFKFMVEKVSKDPISVRQLKINGNDLISDLKIQPGPKIGAILDVLLAKVIDDPKLNDKEKLLKLSKDLNKKDLNDLRVMAKKKIEEEKEEEEKLMKKKYWVE
ncbi:MAG TPA: HD domain-containing protein [Candidatus Moranbacteria bacterium]|nr:HD domain-containing protein [Candidatus Moranbacteria bacterium]